MEEWLANHKKSETDTDDDDDDDDEWLYADNTSVTPA